jgi:hypothetical protein
MAVTYRPTYRGPEADRWSPPEIDVTGYAVTLRVKFSPEEPFESLRQGEFAIFDLPCDGAQLPDGAFGDRPMGLVTRLDQKPDRL